MVLHTDIFTLTAICRYFSVPVLEFCLFRTTVSYCYTFPTSQFTNCNLQPCHFIVSCRCDGDTISFLDAAVFIINYGYTTRASRVSKLQSTLITILRNVIQLQHSYSLPLFLLFKIT